MINKSGKIGERAKAGAAHKCRHRIIKAYTGGPNCRLCKMLNEGCGYLVDGSLICSYKPVKDKTSKK